MCLADGECAGRRVTVRAGEVGVVHRGARPAAPAEGAADPEPAGAAPAGAPAQTGALRGGVAHALPTFGLIGFVTSRAWPGSPQPGKPEALAGISGCVGGGGVLLESKARPSFG